jgi:uncharacterized protein involved in cysteine biosynthesis
LKHRRLLVLAILPTMLSGLFAAVFLWLLWTHLGAWAAHLVTALVGAAAGVWYDVIYYPLVLGGGLIVSLAALYILFVLHSFVAVPFYSVLAERALAQRGLHHKQNIAGMLRMFRIGAVKSVLLLAIGVVLFVLSFVPVLNLAALAVTLLLLAFDCMDYAFEAAGFGLRRRLGYLFTRRAQWAGMAAGLALTLLVPGLTLLVTPGAVVGGALILKE